MDPVNMDRAGWMNEESLLDELTFCVGAHFFGVVEPNAMPEQWAMSEGCAALMLESLVRRGLLNDLGIEQIRKAGIKPL